MGFNSVQQCLNLVNTPRSQIVQYGKALTSTNTVNIPFSSYRAAGYPNLNDTGGTFPAVSKTATILSQSNSGSIPFASAAPGSTNHLIGWSLYVLNTIVGAVWLVDRIVHCQLNLSETNGNFTGFSAVDRLEPTGTLGSGAQIWCEVSENFSNTTSQFYFTYTNQDGTSNRITPVITTFPSATLGNSILPNSGTFIPLQGSDVGVRSIESLTFVSGSSIATGKFAVSLVRPVALACVNNNQFGGMNNWFDFITQLPCAEKIHDDSFLHFICWSNSAVTLQLYGQLQFVCS